MVEKIILLPQGKGSVFINNKLAYKSCPQVGEQLKA